MTLADVKKFVSDFKSGNLKPLLKSEKAPKTETVDGLTTIVSSTHDRIVNDPTKDVLVEYYVDWCAHCMAMAGTYAELAAEVEDIPDLLIAKMNYTKNELEGFQVRHYPTIKFYPKGENKEPIAYQASKTLTDFTNWLHKNSEAYRAANPNYQAEKD